MRIAMGLEYDGRHFLGWQTLGRGRTVQDMVEAALARIADHAIKVYCAGRTDSGVHATGQVIHFDTTAMRDPRSWVLGANTGLPEDVSALWACAVPDDFHARYSAHSRIYRYVILNRAARPAAFCGKVSWCYTGRLDAERMQAGAAALIGEHDFSAYRSSDCQARHPVREIKRLQVWRDEDLVFIEIEANAFLHHMVRNIAGVLIAIGARRAEPSWSAEVLAGRDRTRAGVTAPADGLYLTGVLYPEKYGLPQSAAHRWPY
jgi:tRNA pseudouridine38-40 synthase